MRLLLQFRVGLLEFLGQGLMEAQKFPDDFDAVIAGAPAGVELERVEVDVVDLVVGDAVEVRVDVARAGDADEGGH